MAILEICCGTFESALTAQRAGAHRLELCSALDEGGLTPSYGLLQAVASLEGIRKHVLIRPRGGDFLYTEAEVQIMLRDIEEVKALGFDGVVLGALDADGKIEMSTCRRLMHAAHGMSVTFHRAFDLCATPSDALEQVVELGCDRLLTSGAASTAWEGREALKKWVQQAGERLSIMPGSGVSARNAADIVQFTGADELHASARSVCPSRMRFVHAGVSMGKEGRNEYVRQETSLAEVQALLEILKKE